MSADFDTVSRRYRERVEAALNVHLPERTIEPAKLHSAMRYACLNGGKRVRAMLVYATGQCLGAAPESLDTPACAVELMHAYSLVHDDLPSMDDDDLRRGKPSCHVQYDEATAILVGDALQSLAFDIIARDTSTISPDRRIRMIAVLAQAAGSAGMVGGQAMDIDGVGQNLSQPQLEHVHDLKTGALIRAAVRLGALVSPDVGEDWDEALETYARNIGLAFQVIDDVLDEEADTATLGKPSGTDRASGKPTYPSLIGLPAAKEFARALCDAALTSLEPMGERAAMLRALASLVIDRTH
ncbi:MAG: (2E,6E)-farnesyl diphosphate synthase [Gammaproteobacteria bacterium]|nr:(2E,6E)-farnesyl diphosphate synthase [Gammaproteobacteria bacterium]